LPTSGAEAVLVRACGVEYAGQKTKRSIMGFGRGLLLWLLGIPVPVIILLAIFRHH